MSLTSSVSFNVADADTESAEVTLTIQPPAGYGTGGKGRLVHPVLGTFDYTFGPDEVVNLDGDLIYRSDWLHAKTLTAGVDTLWAGNIRDLVVIERWTQSEVGAPIAHLQALQTYRANPRDPAVDFIVWSPNYATTLSFRVAIVAVRAGGQDYTVNRRMKGLGYAPLPVEIEYRILSAA